MRFRGNGRDVAQRSANVSRFTWSSAAKLTQFEAGMAILLRKWCTFAIRRTDSQPSKSRLLQAKKKTIYVAQATMKVNR
jgi:hypothetical protein